MLHPGGHLGVQVAQVLCELGVLGDLVASILLHLVRRGVLSVLKNEGECLVDLKVGDGHVIGAGDKLFVVLVETTVQEWNNLIKVALEGILVLISDLAAEGRLDAIDDSLAIVLLHEVEERIDLPHCLSIFAVHIKANSEHT